jgi:putative lipoic acid-binding regulatory protein
MSEEETLLEFPCQFPIKAMGKSSSEFDSIIVGIVRRHSDDINEGAVKTRLSKEGKFSSVTVTIEATSKKQLDAIYQDLTDCPEVLMAL